LCFSQVGYKPCILHLHWFLLSDKVCWTVRIMKLSVTQVGQIGTRAHAHTDTHVNVCTH
jgi:hypothetical protein